MISVLEYDEIVIQSLLIQIVFVNLNLLFEILNLPIFLESVQNKKMKKVYNLSFLSLVKNLEWIVYDEGHRNQISEYSDLYLAGKFDSFLGRSVCERTDQLQ
ncbi:hypothetical protein [Leptospira sp. GIMC2001]|uniref:hypothetical protein n=1 Tax=Leptospira sp. GIMC2001 TaxID=1513297 RepID=UPI0023498118|nr:hypothetical protein [Leptospira sp. GIMC2001]WCL49941.1 hypothetical protein O4O04_03735 [Leptospira sp. GIMC2001]